MTFDNINWLKWTKTKSAKDGGQPPERIYDMLLGRKEEAKDSDVVTFDTPEEFEAARRKILEGGV